MRLIKVGLRKYKVCGALDLDHWLTTFRDILRLCEDVHFLFPTFTVLSQEINSLPLTLSLRIICVFLNLFYTTQKLVFANKLGDGGPGG
jgi:hypothetical protein